MPDPDWTQHLTAEEHAFYLIYDRPDNAEDQTVRALLHTLATLRQEVHMYASLPKQQRYRAFYLSTIAKLQAECQALRQAKARMHTASTALLVCLAIGLPWKPQAKALRSALQEVPHA